MNLTTILFSLLLLAPQVATEKTSKGDVKITPITHGTVMFEFGGKVIAVDPISMGVDWSKYPKADWIFITDIHGDHYDPKAIDMIKKESTKFVAPQVVAEKIPGSMLMKNGEAKEFDGVRVEAIPMYNLKRGPSEGKFFHDKGRGNGYVLTYGGKRFYISGDTEGVPEMRALKNIDVAFVCMNLPYTMPPDEAADAVKAFKPKVVIPYHYRGSDLSVFQKALEGTGIEVRLLEWYPN